MKIDPIDLIPMPLNDFRPGGHFYLQEGDSKYARVAFDDKTLQDPHARALIWNWMAENEKKLFLNRCNPWGTFEK